MYIMVWFLLRCVILCFPLSFPSRASSFCSVIPCHYDFSYCCTYDIDSRNITSQKIPYIILWPCYERTLLWEAKERRWRVKLFQELYGGRTMKSCQIGVWLYAMAENAAVSSTMHCRTAPESGHHSAADVSKLKLLPT